MAARKKKDETVLDEPVVEKPKRTYTRKTVKKEEPKKAEPKKAEHVGIGVITEVKLKKLLLLALKKLGVSIKGKDIKTFDLLRTVGKMVGLEEWKPGQGAEHTRDYLARIMEKVNAK